MIPEITQNNVRIFIPYKVAKICAKIAEDENTPIREAVMRFYRSKTAALLADEATKMWQLGWVGLYDSYKADCDE